MSQNTKSLLNKFIVGTAIAVFAILVISAIETHGESLPKFGILSIVSLVILASAAIWLNRTDRRTPRPPCDGACHRDQEGGFSSLSLLITLVAIALVAVVGFNLILKMETVHGNQSGVKETFSGGVDPTSYPPRTYFLWRGLEDIYPYDVDGQVFVMNNEKDETFGHGRRFDRLEIKSVDQQIMFFNLTLRWHRNPTKVVEMHKTYRNNVEERLIRPELIRVMTTHATTLTAVELFSGDTFNKLRSDIEQELRVVTSSLAVAGVVVDSFVLEKPEFADPKFAEKIELRQVALITESMAKEQEKANLAMANASRAGALKEQYEAVVRAETNKQTQILNQEATSQQTIIKTKADADNAVITQEAQAKQTVIQAKANAEQQVVAAEAEAKKQVALSEASKQAELNRAIGIKAVGEATASAQKLQLSAYAVAGADAFVKIEVSKNMAQAYSGVKGFLPEKATYNIMSDNFVKGVSILTGSTVESGATQVSVTSAGGASPTLAAK